jgi:hypothetical protein
VKQATTDHVGQDRAFEPHPDESDGGPGWTTVVIVVAVLCIAALPRSIVLTGFSPIIIVISAIVVVLWRFGKE